jgi:5-formyltetrahydrofolate cyclo-ligase
LYAAVPGEVGTGLIAEAVRLAGGKVYYPRIRPDGDMSFHRVDREDGLVPGRYGIPAPAGESMGSGEPERFDLVVVPGLAFDRRGFRLGRGGGYYDRFLSRVVPTLVVGLAFSWQIVPAVPVDPWDVPMGAVVTEKGVIRVSSASAGSRV